MFTKSIKAYLRTTRVYPPYFARNNTLDLKSFSDDETRLMALYANLLRRYSGGALVFDIGANIGRMAKVLLRLRCSVIAVEPQKACVAALKRTFGNQITIIRAAVSEQAGLAELKSCGIHSLSSLNEDWISATQRSGRFSSLQWGQKETVPVTTLDALIETHAMPDFIKIDVEGNESAVLRGLSRPVPLLSFEFTPEVSTAAIDCIDRLQSLGKYRYNFTPEDAAAFEFQEPLSPDDMRDALRRITTRGDIYARLGV